MRRIISRALLVMQPDLLMPDEPTNHLDANRLQWFRIFAHLSGDCHDLATIANL